MIKKKTMLVCDVLAVLCTVVVFGLFNTNRLMVWHLYALNAISGLMNTVQQPASEVAMTLIIPEKYYQKTSGLRSFVKVVDIHIKSFDCHSIVFFYRT